MGTLPRALGVWLALLAMLVRAGVPDGWMPNPADSPGSPLIICPGQNMMGQNMMMPMPGMPVGKQGQPSSVQQHSCPFGTLGHAPSVQIAAWSIQLEAIATRPGFVPALLRVPAPQTNANAPRGPPLIL